MKVLRTPDERFDNLPGYAFSPNYTEVPDGEGGSLRLHYVDEGPRDGQVVLLMHGEPSWSYLYRKMIPIIVEAGFRAVAPDLIGFGRSDKPAERENYSYQAHVDWMKAFLDTTDLRGITLVCQDWGGLIGLRLAAENGDRFARIVVANTFLATGDDPTPQAFFQWREFSQSTPEFPAGGIVDMGCVSELSAEIVAAYDAPFPDESYKSGARMFPTLVPTEPDNPASEPNRAAWRTLEGWDKPFLTAFSDSDPIMRGGDLVFQTRVPGASSQAHKTIIDGGHFLQEDKGEELAKVVVDFIRAN